MRVSSAFVRAGRRAPWFQLQTLVDRGPSAAPGPGSLAVAGPGPFSGSTMDPRQSACTQSACNQQAHKAARNLQRV